MKPLRYAGWLAVWVLAAGCGSSGEKVPAGPTAYPVHTVGGGAGTEGIRVMLRDGPWGKYVVVVHRAADAWGRVDVSLWVDEQRIEVLRDEMLGPWSKGEVVVELPGSPKMLLSEGRMRLVMVRGKQQLEIAASVEPARAGASPGATTRSGAGAPSEPK